MLERGDDVLFVGKSSVSLETFHCRDAHAGDEVRIFTEGLLDAAPAGITRHIDDGRERLMRTAAAGFSRGHRIEILDELWVEGGGKANGLRKAGAARSGLAMQALFVKDDRDSQPRIFQEEFLD